MKIGTASEKRVDFWFDPACPWTWITSRWVTEVAESLQLSLHMHAFSLYHLNKEKEIPADYRCHLEKSALGAKVAAGVEKLFPESLAAFYSVLGEQHFLAAAPKNAETVQRALRSCGLPAEILSRAESEEFTEFLAASTEEALALVGEDVGVPIISTAGVAFFGPVISPAPRGEAALKLWYGTLALAETPGFFELKRSRTVEPIF